MADRRIRIVVEAESDGSFEGAAKELEDLDKAASGSNDSLGHLSKGHKALDEEIQKTKQAASDLRTEFEKTGNLGLLGDARKLDTQVKKLEQYKTSLGNVGTEARNVSRDLENVGQDVEKISLAGFSIAPQALVPAATAIAPFLGAALSGAINLVGAGGLLAGGIIVAFNNPQVKDGFKALGKDLKAELVSATDGFDTPLIQSSYRLDAAFKALEPDLHRIFDNLAPSIDKLTTGAIGFVNNITPGLERLSQSGGKFIAVFADELPKLGTTITGFLDALDHGLAAKGAVDGLNLSFTALNATLAGTGQAVSDLSTLFELLGGHLLAEGAKTQAFSQGLKGFVENLALGPALGPLAPLLDLIGNKSDKTSRSFQRLGDDAKAAAAAANTASGGFALVNQSLSALSGKTNQVAQVTTTYLNALLGMDQANLSVAQSQTQLSETLKGNIQALHSSAAAIDIHKKAGQEDRAAVLQAVSANIQQYSAMIAVGASAEEAAAAYETNTKALHDTLQAAGLTEAQTQSLIGTYAHVPKNVNTLVAINGLTDAINRLNETLRLINGLHDKTVNIRVITTQSVIQHVQQTIDRFDPSGSLAAARAKGGIDYIAAESGAIVRSPTILFGERQTGAEAYIPKLGISGQRAYGLLSTAASWHNMRVVPNGGYGAQVRPSIGSAGGGTRIVVSAGIGGPPMMQALASLVMSMIRDNYITLTTNQEGRVVVG